MPPKQRPETKKQMFAFETWFTTDENFAKTLDILRKQSPPYKESVDTLYRWAKLYDWEQRATERKQAVFEARRKESIDEQVKFLKRKGNAGRLLQREAMKYLDSKAILRDENGNPVIDQHGNQIVIGVGIKSDYVAINALKEGFNLEGQALGMPEWISELLDADEDTLRRVYEQTLAEFVADTQSHGTEGSASNNFPTVTLGALPQDSKDKP